MISRRLMIAGGLAAALPWRAPAATLTVPVIDRLELTILADGTVSSFAVPVVRPGLKILPPARSSGSYRATLRGEWGYSALADTSAGSVHHRLLIDFGYTPEALASNMALLNVDPMTIEALILSHGHFFVDDAIHEIGTAFHLKGKGLVVIGSCSHRGIVNTIRAAQAVSGIEKIHAVMGGFHLVPPQAPAQAFETLSMLQALKPDFIFPGHCTGEAFIQPAIAHTKSH